MTRIASSPFSIRVQSTPSQSTGLDFPSNSDSPAGAFVAFRFLNPQSNGLPIWGPGSAGATYIWKILPRQQSGYYTTFFWGNNGAFTAAYYGAHPYPDPPPDGSSHNWEISVNTLDVQDTRGGSPKVVANGVWHTQALRVIYNGDNTKTLIYYLALPSVADANVIEYIAPDHYGESGDLPPSPALTFGDAPWSQGNERLSGVLRGIKIFNRLLSEADMLSEAASDALVTPAGQANIWWKKINPTPDDLLCEAGTGRNPQWAQSTKASLWTG